MDKIINMPTGCGEQVMATMAPNLFVLKYLTATKQINSKLYGRIVKNLKIGKLFFLLIHPANCHTITLL